MKKLSLIVSLCLTVSTIGCASTPTKKKKAKATPIKPETVEVAPQGYLLKDSKGNTWVLTVSPDGRLVLRKAEP